MILDFFRRKPRPATMVLHLDDGLPPARPVRELRPDVPPLTVHDFKPKRNPVDPVAAFVVSLSRERQLKLSRIVRHGYGMAA